MQRNTVTLIARDGTWVDGGRTKMDNREKGRFI